MTEPLKPCPFCGGRGVLALVLTTRTCYVSCNLCHSHGPEYPEEESCKAVAGWENRKPKEGI